MPRPPNPTTPEAEILTAAFAAMHQGAKAELAALLDVTPGAVSQYASGNRPVPWDKAPQVAEFTGTKAGDISSSYREAYRHFSALFGASNALRLDPAIICKTIQRMREATKTLEGVPVDVESDPVLFAEMLRLTMLETMEKGEGYGQRRVREAGGQGGGAFGPTRATEAGNKTNAARGGKRKAPGKRAAGPGAA